MHAPPDSLPLALPRRGPFVRLRCWVLEFDGLTRSRCVCCWRSCCRRHPMSYYEAEEDDLLFATNYGIGWYSGIQFPSVKVWMAVGQFSKFSAEEKAKIFLFYQRGTHALTHSQAGQGG